MLYYRELFRWPDGVGVVYVEEDQIRGFAIGVVDLSSFYRHLLLRRGWHFALYALPRLSRIPALLNRLYESMSRSNQRSQSRQTRMATLTSIAVAPEAQEQHIGKRLVIAFLEEMQRRSVNEVSLTTDRRHNERVNKFYEKLGFSLRRFYTTAEGREINEYTVHLALATESSSLVIEASV